MTTLLSNLVKLFEMNTGSTRDGIAPLSKLFRNFLSINAAPALSLELFNRALWDQDALKVAKTGLAKMKSAVAKAIG